MYEKAYAFLDTKRASERSAVEKRAFLGRGSFPNCLGIIFNFNLILLWQRAHLQK
jgi:hypothetical protein